MWCEHGCKPSKNKIGNVTTVGCAHIAIASFPVDKKENRVSQEEIKTPIENEKKMETKTKKGE